MHHNTGNQHYPIQHRGQQQYISTPHQNQHHHQLYNQPQHQFHQQNNTRYPYSGNSNSGQYDVGSQLPKLPQLPLSPSYAAAQASGRREQPIRYDTPPSNHFQAQQNYPISPEMRRRILLSQQQQPQLQKVSVQAQPPENFRLNHQNNLLKNAKTTTVNVMPDRRMNGNRNVTDDARDDIIDMARLKKDQANTKMKAEKEKKTKSRSPRKPKERSRSRNKNSSRKKDRKSYQSRSRSPDRLTSRGRSPRRMTNNSIIASRRSSGSPRRSSKSMERRNNYGQYHEERNKDRRDNYEGFNDRRYFDDGRGYDMYADNSNDNYYTDHYDFDHDHRMRYDENLEYHDSWERRPESSPFECIEVGLNDEPWYVSAGNACGIRADYSSDQSDSESSRYRKRRRRKRKPTKPHHATNCDCYTGSVVIPPWMIAVGGVVLLIVAL